MKLVRFQSHGRQGWAVYVAATAAWHGATTGQPGYPGEVDALIRQGRAALDSAAHAMAQQPKVDLETVEFLAPIATPSKIICVGLNYRDHTAESGFVQPTYPTLFARFNSSITAHTAPLLHTELSDSLDFEGELVVVIGTGGHRISRANALSHVLGYSVFNDGSVREYQFKTPQWTMGKNFDGTGAFGPALVTADELPPGARGLLLETRLNGQTVQLDPAKTSAASICFRCAAIRSPVVRRAEHQSDTQSFAAAHIALWLGFTMKLAILSERMSRRGISRAREYPSRDATVPARRNIVARRS